MSDNTDWVDLAPLDAIPCQGARCVKAPGGRIAIFRTADDRIFAIEDKCPHAGGPLSEGIVHDTSVTCPLHNWVIDLESGQALGADEGRAATLPVKVEEGRILMGAKQLSAAAE